MRMPPAYGSTAVPLLDEHAGPVAAHSSRLRKAAVLVTIVTIGYIATNRFQPPASAQAVLSAGQTSHAYSKDARSMHTTKKDAAKPTCTNTLPKEWQPYIRREGGYYGRNLDDAMTNIHPDFSPRIFRTPGLRRMRSCACSPSKVAGRRSRNGSSAQSARPASVLGSHRLLVHGSHDHWHELLSCLPGVDVAVLC